MTTTHDEVIARLELALRAKASEARRPAEPFDPTPTVGPDPLVQPWGHGPRRPARLAAAVAGVLVLAAAVGLGVRAAGDGASDDGIPTSADAPGSRTTSPDVTTAPPPSTGPGTGAPPDGILVPAWVPDDLTSWSVDWHWTTGETGDPRRHQLFESDDGGRVLVSIDTGATSDGATPGDPIEVRGIRGTFGPTSELGEPATTISWNEQGVSLSATVPGTPLGDAVVTLSQLAWRSDDPADGFDVADGRVSLVAETAPGASGEAGLSAELIYRDDLGSVAAGEGRQLDVTTATAGPAPTYQLLLTMLHGEPGDDGRFESFDPQSGTLSVAWPDGRELRIDANGTSITEDEMRRVADGITEISGPDVARMRNDISARVAEAAPLIGEAELPSGTVRLRRAGGGRIACLVPTGGEELCPMGSGGVWEENGPVTDGFTVDGTWVLASAAPQGTTYTYTRGDDAVAREDQSPLAPDETATVDGLVYVILRPAPEAVEVTAWDPVTGVGFGNRGMIRASG